MTSFPDSVRAFLGDKAEHARRPAWAGSVTRWEEPISFEEDHNQFALALYQEVALTHATRLVLANAVHFKGTWELKFQETDTRDEPFYLEGGGSVPCR